MIRHPSTLTRAENRVYVRVVDGLSNQEIASELNLELRTVKFHLTNIFVKLEVESRAQLIVKHYKKILEYGDAIACRPT